MLDKRLAGGPNPNSVELRAMLAHIPPARKFVLDEPMSKYLLDPSRTLFRGGLRKRINLIENARRLARLPHPLTWIEYDYRALLARAHELGMKVTRGPDVKDDDPAPERCGWLLRQHPKIETAFISTEAFASMRYPGRGTLHPVSIVWCSDDTPLPWRTIRLWKDETDESCLVLIPGYRSTQVGWTFTFREESSTPSRRSRLRCSRRKGEHMTRSPHEKTMDRSDYGELYHRVFGKDAPRENCRQGWERWQARRSFFRWRCGFATTVQP